VRTKKRNYTYLRERSGSKKSQEPEVNPDQDHREDDGLLAHGEKDSYDL
jgi:hypothetical protein